VFRGRLSTVQQHIDEASAYLAKLEEAYDSANIGDTRTKKYGQPQIDGWWKTRELHNPAPPGSSTGLASVRATKNSYSLAFILAREVPGSTRRIAGVAS
jgi:hypothetical protein